MSSFERPLRKMRVLLICHTFSPDMGGASARTWSIAKALRGSGHDVTVLAGRPYYPMGRVPKEYWRRFLKRELQDGLKTIRVWIPALPTIGLWRRLVIYLGFMLSYALAFFFVRGYFDVVYFTSPYPLAVFSLPALLYGKIKRAKVLLDVHDLYPEILTEVGQINSKSAMKVIMLMTKIMAALCDYITPITPSIAERSVQLGIPRSKIKLVEAAVDTDFFCPAESRLKFPYRFVVEYSGILARRYDFGTILEAASMLKSQDGLLFLIRGDGEMKDGLQDSVWFRNSPNVLLKFGFVNREEVLDYLRAADVLVCPLKDTLETRTTIPSKVLEYLAIGKPVVCSATGDIEKMFTESSVGIVTPVGDAKKFAQAIFMLLNNPELRRELATKARQLAETRFALSSLARQIERLVFS